MKPIYTAIILRIGIDLLGFPKFITHYKTDYYFRNSLYFKPYSKKKNGLYKANCKSRYAGKDRASA